MKKRNKRKFLAICLMISIMASVMSNNLVYATSTGQESSWKDETLQEDLGGNKTVQGDLEGNETVQEDLEGNETAQEDLGEDENVQEDVKDGELADENSEMAEQRSEVDLLTVDQEYLQQLDRMGTPEEYQQAKEQLYNGSEIPRAESSNKSILENEYLEIAVDGDGQFTIGTKEGNPNYATDNNKSLLYGHPNPWTSETLIVLDDREYVFSADAVYVDKNGKKATAIMQLGSTDVSVTQTLHFFTNTRTGMADTVKIEYAVSNHGSVNHTVGVRIMLDTMLANNDHAPFKIAGFGNVTESRVLEGAEITQTYQVYDNLDAPTTMAIGTLWLNNERRPDKVQYCNWAGIKGSGWNHRVTNGSYLGDSAVGIYYNPITVTSGNTMNVSTYYGTGIGLGGSSEGIIPIDDIIEKDAFDLYITDSRTGQAVSAATVTIEGAGSVATNAGGVAKFKKLNESLNGTTRNVTITHADYQDKKTTVKIMLGSCKSIDVKGKDDTQPMVESVIMTSANSKYNNKDLLSEKVYFNSNVDKVQPTKTNTEKVIVTVKSDMDNCVYQLISNNKVVKENETGIFELDTLTNNNGTTYTTNRLCDFPAGNKVYLQIISEIGEISKKSLLGISVSQPSSSATTFMNNVSFTNSISLSGLGDAADMLEILLGTKDLDIGASKLPLEIEIDESGKVRAAYNKSKSMSWESFKGDYEKAVINRAGAAKAFGGSAGSFGTGNAKFKMEASGYGEGYFKDGALHVNLGIVVSIGASAGYTHTFFVGWVPLYITVGAKAEASASMQASILNSNELDIKITEGNFEPSISLFAELGVGASGVLSAGVQGKGKLGYSADFLRDYYTVKLTGSASLEVHALLFSHSFSIAEKTWVLYDSYADSLARVSAADVSDKNLLRDLYTAEHFQLTARDYLKLPASETANNCNENVYVNASPVMVQAGNSYYRFWLHDIENRADVNRTAIVYSKYQNGIWTEPAILVDNGTADYNCDVFVVGDDIYIVYQEANKVYTQKEYESLIAKGSTEGLKKMVKDSEVALARLSTKDNTVTDFGTLVSYEDRGALMPRISVDNSGIATVVWYSNSNNNILSEGEDAQTLGTNEISYISFEVNSTVDTIIKSDSKSFGVGTCAMTSLDIGNLNGMAQIAYVLDTDNDYSTVADRELYLAYNLGTTVENKLIVSKETTNVMMDESPSFVKINGKESLIWYQEGNYYYTSTVINDAVAVFDEDNIPDNANNAYAVLDGGENTAIVWGAASPQATGEERYTSLYGAKWNGNQWGNAYEIMRLSEEEDPMITSISGYLRDGLCHVSYGLKKYENGALSASSLCTAVEEKRTDLTLTGIEYDWNQAAAGNEVSVDVTLKNIGNLIINEAIIFFGNEFVSVTDMNLQPGEEKVYTTLFDIPESPTVADYKVKVALNQTAEKKATEEFNICSGYTDLSVENHDSIIVGNSEYYVLDVKNNSAVSAENVNLKIVLDEEESGVVAFDYIFEEPIAAGERVTVLCPADNIVGSKVAYNRLTTTTEEINKENNKSIICVDVEIPDLIATNMLGVKVNSAEAGEVVLPDGFENNLGVYEKKCDTNEGIMLKALAKEGYDFVGWTVEGRGSVEHKYNQETIFYMGDEDVIVTANFATKNPLTGINLEANCTLEIGELFKFNPTLTPTVSSDHLIWHSDDESIVTVDADGEMKAVGVGNATITAMSSSNNDISAVCQVTVNEVSLTKLRMVFANWKIAGIGVEEELRILKTPLNATESIRFESSHPEYVTVDKDGKITSIAPGTAVIKAIGEESGVEASCTITVVNPLTGIYFKNQILNMLKGESKTVAYIENPTGATDSPAPEEIVWSCNNEGVIEIEESQDHKSAVIKAIGTGTAVVSVEIRGTYYASFVVKAKQLIQGISLDDSNLRIKKGLSRYLTYSVTPSDATGDVTWTSSNPAVAEVNSNGKIVGIKEGTATIKVTSDTGYSSDCFVTVYIDKKIVTSINDFQSDHPYSNNMDRTWEYTVKNASSLAVLFGAECLVENLYDFIYIYDKYDNELGKYTGTELAKKTINVSGDTIKVRLTSDSSKTEYGFKVDSVTPKYTSGEVAKKNITSQHVTGVYNQIYTGKAIKVKPVVIVDGIKLKQNRDYKLSYSNNKKIGKKAIVNVQGIGNYVGTASKNFAIVKKSNALTAKNTKISAISNKAYNGKSIKPSVTVKRNGKKLSKSAYTIVYSGNDKIGKATAKIYGKGKYAGSVSVSFQIVPGKASIASVKSTKSKTAEVTVKKLPGVKGYEIYYSSNKNGKYKLAGKTSDTTYQVKKLSKGKVYYFKARGYAQSGKKTYYGAYSKPIKRKVK